MMNIKHIRLFGQYTGAWKHWGPQIIVVVLNSTFWLKWMPTPLVCSQWF